MNKSSIPNDLLRQARRKRGLTQCRLAEELGVDEQTVRSWERGTRAPSLEFRNRLSTILEKSLEELGLQTVQVEQPSKVTPPELIENEVHEQTTQIKQTHVEVLQSNTIPPLRNLPQIILDGTHRKDQNRVRMLRRIRSRWITNVLEHQSHEFLLNSHVKEEPDAVKSPWKASLRETYVTKQTMTDHRHILHIYDDADGELLILGEPGAGKTTLLLILLRELIERAELDDSHPIPVLFHLSEWAEKRLHFADWLMAELCTKYQIPYKLAQSWIETDQIVPLLDGLDEVDETFRTACIEAMNDYRQEHGLLPMIVCSRKSDYLTQPARLILGNAVVIQPLTVQQIDEYISHAGQDLTGMRYAMQQDPLLQEMASNPFMLTILVQSYQKIPIEDILTTESLRTRRNLIIEKYVEQLLQQPSITDDHYTSQRTKHWLKWLARQMVDHNQTEFYLERIQPDWLPNQQVQQHYQRTTMRFIYCIQVVVISALFSFLRGGRIGQTSGVGIGLFGWLGAGPGNSVLGWMAPGLGGGLEGGGSLGIIMTIVFLIATLLIDRPLPKLSWHIFWYSLLQGLRKGLLAGTTVGIFSGMIFGFSNGWNNGMYRGLGAGLFTGLLIGLMTGLITGLRYENPNKVRQRKNRYTLRLSRDTAVDTCIFTLCATISVGIVYALLISTINTNVITYATIIGVAFGIALSLCGGTKLIRDIGTDIQPAETVAWSWKEVGRHFTSNVLQGLRLGIVIMVSVTIIITGASGFFYGITYGLRYGLVYGLIIGMVSGVTSILAGLLNSGWSNNVLEEHQLVHANEGIRRSAHNALIAACFFGGIGGIASGLVCGVAFGWVGQLRDWPILGAGFAIVFGIIFALQAAILNGGIACIAHSILRLYLWRAGSMPWKYSRFLDFTEEHIVLRKLGGGYMFSHHLLLEYFASLHSTSIQPQQQETIPHQQSSITEF